jgi:hypothetical protein
MDVVDELMRSPRTGFAQGQVDGYPWGSGVNHQIECALCHQTESALWLNGNDNAMVENPEHILCLLLLPESYELLPEQLCRVLQL